MSEKRINVGGVVVVEPNMGHLLIVHPSFSHVKRVEMPYQQLEGARERAADHDNYDSAEARKSAADGEFPLPVIDLSGGTQIMVAGWSTYDKLVMNGITLIPVLLVASNAQGF